MRVVSVRKAGLSVFIVVVCFLQLAQGALQIENFPLTSMGMFRAYRGVDAIPWTYRVEAYRRGRWIEVRPWLLNMRPGTFDARLGKDLGALAARCGALGDLHNRLAAPNHLWRRMRVKVTARVRDRSGAAEVQDVVECRLDPEWLP